MPDFIAKPVGDSAKRPPCPNCGSQMLFARIKPDSVIPDRQTFECLKCNLAESSGGLSGRQKKASLFSCAARATS